MRILMTLTAALVAATAIASSASAGHIGCDPGQPHGTLNDRSCRVWNNGSHAMRAPQRRAAVHAYAAAPIPAMPPWDTGVSGGAAN